VAAVGALTGARQRLLVAAPVLVELAWLLSERLGYGPMIRGLQVVRENFQIEPLLEPDLVRIESIMQQYATSRLGYVDTAIMALSERLLVTQI
jgi:hypothetical protein